MISVIRSAPPAELTVQKIQELTAIFIADPSRTPWNVKFMREALLQMSHRKCVYCETRIDEESKYMEVDHYFCKSRHPTRVVEWENLLPSCKRCNVNKGGYDVATEGDIVNPTVDTPSNHLSFWNYRLYGRDDKGMRCVETLYLNETSRIVSARAEIGNAVAEAFEKLKLIADDCAADPTQNRKINQLVRGLKKMLEETQPMSEYGATAATVISSHPIYSEIKATIQNLKQWGAEIATLEGHMLQAALPSR